jgi:hypothetical protein
LTASDVACWLLKSTSLPASIAPDWEPGAERVLTRCLRRSYRLDLLTAGQPCVLWVSGAVAPGVHAVGTVLGAPRDGGDGPVVEVALTRLTDPLARTDLLADPRTAGAEVLRMPAGSNPSWLSPRAWDAVHGMIAAQGRRPAVVPPGRTPPSPSRSTRT